MNDITNRELSNPCYLYLRKKEGRRGGPLGHRAKDQAITAIVTFTVVLTVS
jgi:hypothetical protein